MPETTRPEITRDELHQLVAQLPESQWAEAKWLLLECLEEAGADKTEYDPREAPEVTPTPLEIADFEEYYADLKAGRVKTIPHEEIVKELLELP